MPAPHTFGFKNVSYYEKGGGGGGDSAHLGLNLDQGRERKVMYTEEVKPQCDHDRLLCRKSGPQYYYQVLVRGTSTTVVLDIECLD